MKIVHINRCDIDGGAGRAVYRLHTGLCRLGYESYMFVAHRRSNDLSVRSFTLPMNPMNRLRRRMRQIRITSGLARYQKTRPSGYEAFGDDRSTNGAELLSQIPGSEVINLHRIAGFVNHQVFFRIIPQHTLIVWTLHDMNAFTGGCQFDNGCGKYRDQCGACPQLGSSDPNDLSRQIWLRKRKTYELMGNNRLHIVTPSRWLAEEAKHSTLLGRFPISVIPNSIDTDVFSPRDRYMARAALEIPKDAEVILFVADSAINKRKGFTLLTQALAGLDNLTNLFLVSLGSDRPAIDVPFPWLHMGYVDNDRLLSLIYSAADLFVIPSIQDNLPNTMLESLACGTPIVGFNTGGVPDVVRPGVTGMMAVSQDMTSLRAAIVDMLQNPEKRAEMSVNCRRIAIEEYSIEVQASRYAELYKTILAQN